MLHGRRLWRLSLSTLQSSRASAHDISSHARTQTLTMLGAGALENEVGLKVGAFGFNLLSFTFLKRTKGGHDDWVHDVCVLYERVTVLLTLSQLLSKLSLASRRSFHHPTPAERIHSVPLGAGPVLKLADDRALAVVVAAVVVAEVRGAAAVGLLTQTAALAIGRHGLEVACLVACFEAWLRSGDASARLRARVGALLRASWELPAA